MPHGPGRSVPAFDLRRAWREPPAVSAPAAMRWTNVSFWLLGGLVLLVASSLLGWETADRSGIAAIGGTAVVVGLVILAFGLRFRRWTYHLLSLVGTALITVAVLLGGGGASALALSCPFLFVMTNAAFMFSLRAAAAHIALAETAAVVTLTHHGLPAGEILLVAGCKIGSAAVVGWLARVANAAEEDAVTGLLNRRGLDRKLEEAMRAAAGGHPLSLALIDIDRFQTVNEDEGQHAADRLLQQCAEAMRERLPDAACLGRYAGDTFALLIPDVPLGRAADLADELRSLRPGSESITMSAGVAAWEPGDSASMLMSRADVALYDAKSAGRDRTVVHGDPDRSSSELEAAIERGELRLYRQPIVQLTTRETIGYEALVRWHHPTRGVVYPGDFVPNAERTGAIRSLGRWMLGEVCRTTMSAPGPRVSVGLNASVRELQDPRYADDVRRELQRWSMPGNLLVVEVTESAVGGEDPRVLQNLHRLRDLGVLVAIDDFGSGYSSFKRLETFPINVLKIDGSLVSSIREESTEAPVLEAIIALARALGVKVVAEWVETEHQARLLTRIDCDFGQGFLLGAPEPVATGDTEGASPGRT
ncbi:MAG TPA: bifunctional diguanylate cyclase/phosphodiesterase [Nocardioides sp.]|uniref:putative bifunctional diguanylate cyclase/phosphodiesterase n=1 Tax=Nocardioides sp. TaxID=35761 RepID=UPI002ED8867A